MKYKSLLFSLLFSVSAFAQKKVEHIKKTDEILVDGIKWATAPSLKGNGNYQRIIAVKDLSGKDIVYGKLYRGAEANYYEIQFAASGRIAYKTPGRLNVTRDLAMFLVEYEALTKEGLNQAGEDKIVSLFSNPPLPQTSTGNSQYIPVEPNSNSNSSNNNNNNNNNSNNNNYWGTLVERNRQATVYVFGDKIQQDFKTVGFIEDKSRTLNGEILVTYTIRNHQNTLLGEATVKLNGTQIQLTTFKDNQLHQINSQEGFGRSDIKKAIALYLNERYYW